VQPDVQAAFLGGSRAGLDPVADDLGPVAQRWLRSFAPRMRARSLAAAAAAAALALAAAPAVGGVDAPTVAKVVVAAAGPSAATVTWSAGAAARTWVQVGRTAAEGVWYRGLPAGGDRYTATLTSLAPGAVYHFGVRAVNAAGGAETDGTVTAPAIPPSTWASTGDQSILLDGRPFFPIMAWWQCPDSFDRLLELGIDLFMGGCKDLPGEDVLGALAGRAYATLPVAQAGVEGRGLIGWNFPDEPEGFGIPASALPDLPVAASSGRLRLLTSTYHFFTGAAPLAPNRGREIYPAYFSKADVVGFDLYPLEKFCGNAKLGLRSDFDIQRELVQDVAGKPTYQWIETGQLEGECRGSPDQVTPATVRAEAWMAIAGGARGIGYFTHTWTGPWQRFNVAPDVQVAIARTNEEIGDLAPALLGRDVHAGHARTGPVVVGARTFNGALYVIAVNPTNEPVTAAIKVSALRSRALRVFGENRALRPRRGVLRDVFKPLSVHVYVAPPPGEGP
jgi:hypothetical protein